MRVVVDLEIGVRVTFDVGYLYANFRLLDLGPMHATDKRRQTSDAHHRLMHPPYGGGGMISKYASATATGGLLLCDLLRPSNCSRIEDDS